MLTLTNKQYDRAKWLVQIAFPAFSTFYLTLGQIWGLPSPDKVVGTLAALATFGGVILGVNSKKYNASSEIETNSDISSTGLDPNSVKYDSDLYEIYKNSFDPPSDGPLFGGN